MCACSSGIWRFLNSSAEGDFDVCMYKHAAITLSIHMNNLLPSDSFSEIRVFWKVLSTNWLCCYWLLHSSGPVRFWWTSSLWRKAREEGNGAPQIGRFGSGMLTCTVLSCLEILLQIRPTAERRDLLEAHNSLWCIRICRNKFSIIYQTILIVNIHTPTPTRACFWKQLENFIYMCAFTGECGKSSLLETLFCLGACFPTE